MASTTDSLLKVTCQRYRRAVASGIYKIPLTGEVLTGKLAYQQQYIGFLYSARTNLMFFVGGSSLQKIPTTLNTKKEKHLEM